jgi:hypothetical protein
MPDLKWTVRVDRWTWIYSFSHLGTVSWQDPNTKEGGKGTWRIVGDYMITRWFASKTEEKWNVPIDPNGADGTCTMGGTNYPLKAVALNYYLGPGDVIYSGEPIFKGNGTVATVIYPDVVRTGGSVAWLCRNPGNIQPGAPAEKYGAYPGKQVYVNKVGPFAIFPDESTGLMAVISVLRSYGHMSILDAMRKYAPKGHGHNNPDAYAKGLADGLKVSQNTDLVTLSDEQMEHMADLITGVETLKPGTEWARDNVNLPEDIRRRLGRPLYPLTDEDIRNSSLGVPW